MSLDITDISPVSQNFWRQIYERCDYATFFHSPAWSNIWLKFSDGKLIPESKLVVFSDEFKAVIVLSRNKQYEPSASWKYVSSPAGTFGGWISTDPLTQSHGLLLQDILLKIDNLIWRINPYDPIALQLERPGQTVDETMVIDLRKGLNALMKKWKRKSGAMLYSVRKARKAGLVTRQAETIDDWRDYFGLYEKSLERWGSKVSSGYDWKLFELLAQEPSKTVKLWLVGDKDRAVGGAVVFYAKRHAVYWHGAADADWFHLCPINLMLYDIITDMFNMDYWWFDFNPSGGHQGVARFKRHCGGEPLPSPVVKT